jgi:hypothetical protein
MKFRSMFTPNDESDSISVDLRRIHDMEPATTTLDERSRTP